MQASNFNSALEIERHIRSLPKVSTVTTYEFEQGAKLLYAVRPRLLDRLRCAVDIKHAYRIQTELEYSIGHRLPEGIEVDIIIIA